MTSNTTAQHYKIGTVSRITGISPETLRMWERRYGIVSPARGSSRTRLYSDDDITHLSLLKRLISLGHPIGSLADLSVQELQERLDSHASMTDSARPTSEARPVKVCVLGQTLPHVLQETADEKGPLQFAGLYTNVSDFEKNAAAQAPDVLVLEYPSLQSDDIKAIRQRFRLCNARHLVIVYDYSQTSVLNRLRAPDVSLTRAPVDYAELMDLCRVQPAKIEPQIAPAPSGHEARRFSDSQLSKIGRISTDIGCECPHHVTDILTRLIAFETYSRDCEDRNAEDAALHAHLYQVTSQARAIFEDALSRILEVDGINLKKL